MSQQNKQSSNEDISHKSPQSNKTSPELQSKKESLNQKEQTSNKPDQNQATPQSAKQDSGPEELESRSPSNDKQLSIQDKILSQDDQNLSQNGHQNAKEEKSVASRQPNEQQDNAKQESPNDQKSTEKAQKVESDPNTVKSEIMIDTAALKEEPRYKGMSIQDIRDNALPGLSAYQVVCKPRVLAEDDPAGEEMVSIKTFKDLLLCPICFNLLKDPEGIRFCMHKFCQSCVEQVSRNSRQCPQCRVQIGSRRVWRTDILTKKIIDVLVDDIDEFDKNENEARSKQLKESFNFKQFSAEMLQGISKQKKQAVEEDKKVVANLSALTLEQRRENDNFSQALQLVKASSSPVREPKSKPQEKEIGGNTGKSISGKKGSALQVKQQMSASNRSSPFPLPKVKSSQLDQKNVKSPSQSPESIVKVKPNTPSAQPFSLKMHLTKLKKQEEMVEKEPKGSKGIKKRRQLKLTKKTKLAAELAAGAEKVTKKKGRPRKEINLSKPVKEPKKKLKLAQKPSEGPIKKQEVIKEDCEFQGLPDKMYEEFVNQFTQETQELANPIPFKTLQDLPKSVLADAEKLDRSSFPKFDVPHWIEFSLRYEGHTQLYKLISMSSDSTILTVKQYILERMVPRLFDLDPKELDMFSIKNICVYWVGHKQTKEIYFQDNQQLKSLISGKYWRIDNLTPGLDLLENFYHCAVQGDNYEQIREKLYFRIQ